MGLRPLRKVGRGVGLTMSVRLTCDWCLEGLKGNALLRAHHCSNGMHFCDVKCEIAARTAVRTARSRAARQMRRG